MTRPRPAPLLPLARCGAGACATTSGDSPTDDAVDTDIVSCAPVPLPGESDLDPAVAGRLQDALDAALIRNAAPGATAAVSLPGLGVFVGASGTRDTLTGEPLEAWESLAWGSITKTSVAVWLLALEGEGLLSLDDTVHGWFPTLPGADTATVRHLLSHTSGLHDYTAMPAFYRMLAEQDAEGWSVDDILALAAAEGPDFAPGAAWSYSNTNYFVLGRIAEELLGASAAAQLDARVRTPFGLERTWLRGFEDLPPCAPPAPGHLAGDAAFPIDPAWQWTSGGLFSDVRDLLRWGLALFEDPALAPVLARMSERATPLTEDGDPAPYGLGLFLTANACGPVRGHTGSTMGFQSDLFRTDDGIVVAVLQNDFAREATDLAEALCLAARAELTP